jgi:hypothetical protein
MRIPDVTHNKLVVGSAVYSRNSSWFSADGVFFAVGD